MLRGRYNKRAAREVPLWNTDEQIEQGGQVGYEDTEGNLRITCPRCSFNFIMELDTDEEADAEDEGAEDDDEEIASECSSECDDPNDPDYTPSDDESFPPIMPEEESDVADTE